MGLPVRHHAQRAVEEQDVPVGLRAGRDLRRVVGAVEPDRVDLGERRERGDHAEDHEEEAVGLEEERRVELRADDDVLGLARAGEVGVLLVPQDHHVRADQREQDARDQQHVDDEQPRDDVVARDSCRRTGSSTTYVPTTGIDSATEYGDPQAGAGQQVVGQRVAGEALEDRRGSAGPMPMCQLIVRGLRNAPVKKTRNMCTTIDVVNSSAAQWWIWRISSPPRTSKEMCSVEA